MRLMMSMAGARHGGAEAFFERLAVAFFRRDVKLQVAIRRDDDRAGRLRAAGIQPTQLSYGGPFDFSTRRKLTRAVNAFSPHIFLSFMSRAAKLAPPARPAERLHIARLGGYYAGKYYQACDHLIGNTTDICRHLVEEEFAVERVHYLPNFVDERPATAADRAQYGTPVDAPLVLAMGRLHENKAFDILIEGLAEAPGIHLWLAGDGALAPELKGVCRRKGLEGRVRFLGWIDDPSSLLEAADIVAVPSRREPLGNVVLEAWARRKPVVAAASEGPRQLIDDGSNGLLCAVDDVAGLAACLRRLTDDKEFAETIATAGYKSYCERFSEASVVDAYLTLFQRLCDDANIDWKGE